MNTTVRGRIIAVQEERLHLRTPVGHVLRLDLSNRAGLEIRALRELQAVNAEILVEYSGEANLATGTIRAIRRAN